MTLSSAQLAQLARTSPPSRRAQTHAPRPGIRAAFTLVELLVVVGIIALLLGILTPSLAKARRLSLTTKCLSNLRNMQVAHWMYMTEHRGAMVDVGLSHGGSHANEQGAWINTLADYYGNELLHRSPVDDSPHWSKEDGGQGVPITGTTDQFRRTSYGANNFLTSIAPFEPVTNLNQVPAPAVTVHYLIMAFEGSFAGADHPHVENWGADANTPLRAAAQVQINAHGDKRLSRTFDATSNWGFLDGHAQTLTLKDVYTDSTTNRFDPKVAQ